MMPTPRLAARITHCLAAVALMGFLFSPSTARAENTDHHALGDPELATRTAPDAFRVRFETTKGEFVVAIHRSWAPRGVDRFYNLVAVGFYDDVAFFRVIDEFVAQFGIHGDPDVNEAWSEAAIADDPVARPNLRGTLTFASAGPDTRTTQLFINLVDNERLDEMGFAPFGRVVEGFAVVEALHSGYGEAAPMGSGPAQARIAADGNRYLRKNFPDLDYVIHATIEPAEQRDAERQTDEEGEPSSELPETKRPSSPGDRASRESE